MTSADSAGEQYQRNLLRAITAATRIVVTEHSNQHDLIEWDIKQSRTKTRIVYVPNVYATATLSDAQKQEFYSIVSSIDSKTQDLFSGCAFEPHHKIRFFEGSRLSSTMEICFLCGEVNWDGSDKTPPKSIYGGLHHFIEQIGMHPDRDWRAAALDATSN